MLLLPIVLFPAFFSFYSTAKLGIPVLRGFAADRTLADLDTALLGTDAWRVPHALLGRSAMWLIEFCYVPLWFAALGLSQILVPMLASRRFAGRFALALMLSWLIGGVLVAYLLPSAGPIFAHLVDPEFGRRFAPLSASLREIAPDDSYVLSGVAYLESGLRTPGGVAGGGISAMPSMHVATAVLLALAARRTSWFAPATGFAVVIYVGSIHTGFHYALDGIVSAVITFACWRASERLFARFAPGGEPVSDMVRA